ncbi:inseCt neurotoxin 1c [Intestinimonas massiliensis]|uniref:InseCt neurotoxin 1c n=1 Tax=Intestinimonas massiliensis (ex Afouda et al. 2020) TaxID=1673721 RepID=A0AAW5JQV7_9FIRM|nr:inseCt neurotoxin 1c [Intestinimonas massiliensis (ex Afouda et al. 2020)]MCQ4770279.1 inseCt neurotoxin 1c [Intestinimonas massiliensis (ex Afouda et al. 2020)]
MTELLWFIVGLFIGGIVAVLVLCCLQINRISKHEAEIRCLKSQLNNK